MRKILMALAAASTLMAAGGAASNAQAQPVRWFNGQRYCWYGNGWKGAGWFGCGYAWRRGWRLGWPERLELGWGGGGVVVGALQAAAGPVGVAVGGPGYGHAWGGQRYCWFDSGWHGAGWYGCGYGAWRRGYGWGGGRGWNRW